MYCMCIGTLIDNENGCGIVDSTSFYESIVVDSVRLCVRLCLTIGYKHMTIIHVRLACINIQFFFVCTYVLTLPQYHALVLY